MCDDDSVDDPGVLCRHSDIPNDCEEKCHFCGHLCINHGNGFQNNTPCSVKGCDCEEWEEET